MQLFFVASINLNSFIQTLCNVVDQVLF